MFLERALRNEQRKVVRPLNILAGASTLVNWQTRISTVAVMIGALLRWEAAISFLLERTCRRPCSGQGCGSGGVGRFP